MQWHQSRAWVTRHDLPEASLLAVLHPTSSVSHHHACWEAVADQTCWHDLAAAITLAAGYHWQGLYAVLQTELQLWWE